MTGDSDAQEKVGLALKFKISLKTPYKRTFS
jgi:hypothetical protein